MPSVRSKDEGYVWSAFELRTMLCLIAKGVHLEEGCVKRSEQPGSSRINAYENFATQLNFALHGKDYESDINKREVTRMLDQILEERKHVVGKGGLLGRFPGGRITAAMRLAFSRSDIWVEPEKNRKKYPGNPEKGGGGEIRDFDGSLTEWENGRKERVMGPYFMKMNKFKELEKLGFKIDQYGNAIGLGLTIGRYGKIIADENIAIARAEAEKRSYQKSRRSAAAAKKPRISSTKQSTTRKLPLSDAIVLVTDEDVIMSSIETDDPRRGPPSVPSTQPHFSNTRNTTESTYSTLSKAPARLPTKPQEYVDLDFLYRTRSAAPTTKAVDGNDLFGTGGSGFKPINWAATANDSVAMPDDGIQKYIAAAAKDNGVGGGSSRRRQNHTDNIYSAADDEMYGTHVLPAERQNFAVLDLDLFGGAPSKKN